MPPKLKFAEGEKVLCFHGPLIYEAKCLKASVVKDKQIKYLIHYAGWNKNWDEWVPENRVLKYNEVNVAKQKEVQKAHSSQAVKTKKKSRKSEVSSKETDSRASTPNQEITVVTTTPRGSKARSTPSLSLASVTPSTSQDVDFPKHKGKRARLDTSTTDTEETCTSRVEIKIKVTDELKAWLIDDWDLIVRQKKLVNLPAESNIESIFSDYLSFKKNNKFTSNQRIAAVEEMTNGIREYFKTILSQQLLYKFERPQYTEILKAYPNKSVTEIYGAIHLVRLFIKLGPILAYTSIDEKSIQLLLNHFQDIMKFLASNTYFNVQHYINPPSDYHRKIQS